MKHTDIRSVLAPEFAALAADSSTLPDPLRDYQADGLKISADWLSDPSGTKRSYFEHATGLGKTHLFAAMIRAAHQVRSLVIVPTKPLLAQTARKVAKYTGGVIGHLSSFSNIADRDGEIVAVRGMEHSSVLITTDASFNKYYKRIATDFNPQLILRDECHWGYYAEAIAALSYFKQAVVIGFSATPDLLTNRAKGGYTPVTLENGQVLYGPRDKFAETHFQTRLDRRSLRWGIESGWLAPLAWGLIDFDQIDLGNIPIVDGPDGPDYDKTELQRMLEEHWSVMCETIRRLYEAGEADLPNRQAYAVCPSVDAAEKLTNTIMSLGISAACVTGMTPDTERDVIFEAYRANEIRFIASVRVLREGWDMPNAEVCMMLRPTASHAFYVQPIGRCVRIPEDGSPKVALVLDAHFQGKTFMPLSAPALFAPPGSEVPVRGLLLGGGGGGVRDIPADSPLLPKDARPKVIVVENYAELQVPETPLADKEGFFKADGERWGLMHGLSKKFKLSWNALRPRIIACRTRDGRDQKGQSTVFYAVQDVKKACRDLLKKQPRANKSGFIMIDGEQWGVSQAIADRHHLVAATLRARCKNCRTTLGRDHGGRKAILYAVQDVKKACRDFLKKQPRVNKSGFIRFGGHEWGMIYSISKRLKVTRKTLGKRLKTCRPREGRDSQGHPQRFYKLTDAKRVCRDLIKPRDRADKTGFFRAEGEVWGSRYVLAKKLGLSHSAVNTRIGECRARQGVDACGVRQTFYALKDMKRACANLLKKRGKKRSSH